MKKFYLSPLVALFLIGCNTVPVGQDPILIHAQKAVVQAKIAMNTFLHIELGYSAQLAKIDPNIHVYAETVRAHGQEWLKDGWDAVEAYRLTKDQTRLEQALAVLASAQKSSQAYIDQAKQNGVVQ